MRLDGKSLERATELIEKHILDHIEKKEIGQISVQSNKIITVNGVRHEIDLYITIDLEIGTKLLYIFECKNCKTKVISKNDIIVFDEKIDAIGAQKGYFVAKKYSKYSVNRAKQNPRIKLLTLDSENSRIFDPDFFIQIKTLSIKDCKVNMKVNPPIPFDNNFSKLPIELTDGRKQTIEELISEKVSIGAQNADKYKTKEGLYKKNKNQNENQGESEFLDTIIFKEDNWIFKLRCSNPILNNVQYSWIEFTVNVKYEVEIPEIIYEFNIEDKGHYVKIKFKDLFGNKDLFMELTKVGENNIHVHNITKQ